MLGESIFTIVSRNQLDKVQKVLGNYAPPQNDVIIAEIDKKGARLLNQLKAGVVAEAGLLAHGRGEAFDYLLGERTSDNALKAIETAVAALLTAKHSVISVNGNAAALAANEIVKLADKSESNIEVNLFYRSIERETAIEKLLKEAGARKILGVGKAASAKIPELQSKRRRVDPTGIMTADVVLIPLEDGDRTEALVKMGKKVIAIDLNPLSRTAQSATITIVDNIVRALPKMVEITERLRKEEQTELNEILKKFSNKRNLMEAIDLINKRLNTLAEKGMYI
jgi:4-phosphopantoate--beta-alanine ligase